MNTMQNAAADTTLEADLADALAAARNYHDRAKQAAAKGMHTYAANLTAKANLAVTRFMTVGR